MSASKTPRLIRRQAGLTLAETLMVLAIGAVAIVGGTILYMQATNANKRNAGVIQLTALAGQIRSLHSGTPSFGDGAMEPVLVAANAVPPDMRIAGNTTGFRNAWGGSVNVAAIASGSQFTITFRAVPADGCVTLASLNSGAGGGAYQGVSVNGQPLTLPVNVSTAAGACKDQTGGNLMVFSYQ